MSSSHNLPYPTSAAEAASFPWPDENAVMNQQSDEYNQQSAFNPAMNPQQGAPSAVPYPVQPSGAPPYPGQAYNQGSPYPPNPGPYQQASNPYPAAPQQSPYPPSSSPYPAGPQSSSPYPPQPHASPYPPSSNPYPPQPTSSPYPPPGNVPNNPYPPQAQSGHPGYPASPPPGQSPYPSESREQSGSINLNNMPGGKFLSKNKGLSKMLNQGMNIAQDMANKHNINIPINIGGSSGGSSYPDGNIPPQRPPPPQPQQPPPQSHGGYFPSLPSNPFSSSSSSKSEVQNFRGQDYDQLKRSCQSSNSLFKDPEFPANNRLLVDDASNSIFSYRGLSKFDPSMVEWLRPTEICRNPQMFVGEFNRFDINQGEIGNCWFLAALANLAENRKCFERVVPMNQGFGSGYTGIFRFRFWRFGKWVEVVIDDRLPTRNGKLIYVRSTEPNEFWSALLEKAYAKLHGSYKALEGGLTIEAAVDFTGGIPEMIDLDNGKMSPERIFYIMSKADARGAFMGCALSNSRVSEAQRMGLQSRHAYTITKVVEIRSPKVRGGIPLVRLRNPHGNDREWRGEWSDGDRNWKMIPSNLRSSLGLTYEDDGEFYMNFRDFLRYFGELEICHLGPESVESADNRKKFEVFHFYGEWRAGVSSGGCGNEGMRAFATNPQFFINLSDPDPYDDESCCPVVISLLQQQKKRKSEHAIGFKVYSVDLQTRSVTEDFMRRHNSVDKTDTFINLREIGKRLVLPQGRYCIIPSTFRRGEEGEFLLRVFVEKRWGSSEQGQGHIVRDSMDNAGGGGGAVVPDYPSGGMSGLDIGGGGGSYIDDGRGKKKSKYDKAFGFALKQLEKNFPESAKGLKKLRDIYNWATDSESEHDLLKNIIKSMR